jgi:cell division protein FtsW
MLPRSKPDLPAEDRTPVAPDRVIFWIALCLLGLGAVSVFSASAHLAGQSYDRPLFYFQKQVLFFLCGFSVLIGASRIPYTFWQRTYRIWILVGLVVLIAVLFMPPVRGARRWMFLGPLRLQAAEVFRFATVVFIAAMIAKRRRGDIGFKKQTLPFVVLLAIGSILIMLEPDLGATLLLAGTVFALLFFGGVSIKHLAGMMAPAALACAILVFAFGYKQDRFANYLDAVRDPLAAGYQVKQGIVHMGVGGLTGTGLGEGMAKFFYVPDAHTDFIFASVGEELGFITTILILSAYALLLLRGLRIARRAPDKFSSLLVAGFTASLGVQIAINLGVVLALLPPTGIPLPLLSYGGSSVLFTTGALAVILNVSRHVRD